MNDQLKLAGLLSLADVDMARAQVVNEDRLSFIAGGFRVVAVMMCAEVARVPWGGDAMTHDARIREPELQVRPKFLIAQSTNDRIAELERDLARESKSAEASARRAADAAKELEASKTALCAQMNQAAVASASAERARHELTEARDRCRKMEADLGKLRAEIGEKEVRRILEGK